MVAYAYLDHQIVFTTPFDDAEKPMKFVDAVGNTYSVRAFGLHESMECDLREKQAKQVRVLFSRDDRRVLAPGYSGLMPGMHDNPTAFALDLTADQADRQLIVAVIPRPEDFNTAMDYLAQQIKEFPPEDCPEELLGYLTQLHATDTLAIPNVAFDVDHDFRELLHAAGNLEEGADVVSAVQCARQRIRFRLDKSGATLVSESMFVDTALPRNFIVNRPFLVVIRRRLAEQPYFMAWVDNHELLEIE